MKGTHTIVEGVLLGVDSLVGLVLAGALIWLLREFYKVFKLFQEDRHQVEQIREELEKIQQESDEICLPINSNQEGYRIASCPLCHRRLTSTTSGIKHRAKPKIHTTTNLSQDDHQSDTTDNSSLESFTGAVQSATEETHLLLEEKRYPNSLAKNNNHNNPLLLTLRCGHEFHTACIFSYMAIQRHNCDPCRCPVCLQGLQWVSSTTSDWDVSGGGGQGNYYSLGVPAWHMKPPTDPPPSNGRNADKKTETRSLTKEVV